MTIEYIVNRIFTSRTYILSKGGDNRIWLVDCGDIDRVFEMYPDKIIEGVLLTHTHSDHIYGLNQLIEEYPQVMLFTNEYGYEALISPQRNISRYHTEYEDIILSDRSNVDVITEGAVIDVLGERCEVFETPGHDPSCLCFRIGGKIFTGDAYIPGVKVFTGFPFSDKQLASNSMERILTLSSGLEIYPGHELQSKP